MWIWKKKIAGGLRLLSWQNYFSLNLYVCMHVHILHGCMMILSTIYWHDWPWPYLHVTMKTEKKSFKSPSSVFLASHCEEMANCANPLGWKAAEWRCWERAVLCIFQLGGPWPSHLLFCTSYISWALYLNYTLWLSCMISVLMRHRILSLVFYSKSYINQLLKTAIIK